MRGFFPVARGVKTDRYTMEIAIKRNGDLSRVMIFDDLKDPYQMRNLDWRSNPGLFRDLCAVLAAKLEEADDIWHREGRLESLFPEQFGK